VKLQDTLDENIKHLTELKDSLIQVVEDTSNTKELQKRFMQLAHTNDEFYELMQTLTLMQDISLTNQKNFKKVMIEYIKNILNSKIEHYKEFSKLELRITSLEKAKGIQVPIPILGKVSLKDGIFFIVMTFTIVVVSYIIEPKATDSALDSMAHKTETTLGISK